MKFLTCIIVVLYFITVTTVHGGKKRTFVRTTPVPTVDKFTEAAFMTDIRRGYEKCKDDPKNQPDKSEIEQLHQIGYLPKSEGGKCLLTCIFDKGDFGRFGGTKEGTFFVELKLSRDKQYSAEKIINKVSKSTPEYLPFAEYIAFLCTKRIGAICKKEACELGPKILECFADNFLPIPVIPQTK